MHLAQISNLVSVVARTVHDLLRGILVDHLFASARLLVHVSRDFAIGIQHLHVAQTVVEGCSFGGSDERR